MRFVPTVCSGCLGALLLGFLPPGGDRAFAEPATPPAGAAPADSDACTSYTLEYALAARLRLEDTPWGAGNGVYDVGPGRLVLRVFAAGTPGKPARVELVSYEMREHFFIDSSVLFIHAAITTKTETRAEPDSAGFVATGTLSGRTLAWSTPVRNYRTNGTILCKGSGCGMSGVPPEGTMALHIGPSTPSLDRFVFDSPNLETFRMDFTRVAHTDMPRQTAFITFSGRKMKRTCTPAAAK